MPPAVGTASSPAAGRGTFPPSADGESPAEVQRKTLRPERANPLTQFACPGFPVQKRSRPLGANTLTLFACPGQPVQKRSRPERANTLTQFAHPGFPVQRKEPPRQGEPADAVRAPRWVGAENSGNPEKIFPTEKAAKTPVLTLRNGYPNGIVSKT